MRKNYIIAFLLGMSVFLLLGYTRDWTESTPTDSTVANQIDDYNRYLRVDMSDRLKNMIYGFTAGETTEGFKYLQFYEQSSVSQPSAAYGRLYGKAVSGKCEMHYQDEDGDEIPMTNGGNIGGANVELVASKDLIGSSTSDITINTNKFTVAGATGNTVVAGTFDVTGNIDPTTYETTNGGFLNHDSMTGAADNTVASSDSIVKYATLDAGGVLMHDAEGGFSNCDINGTKTKVYTKYFTGTLDGDSSTTVAHSVTSGATKILSVTFAAKDSGAGVRCFEMFRGTSATASVDLQVDDTNVTISNVGTALQSQIYRIRIDYIL